MGGALSLQHDRSGPTNKGFSISLAKSYPCFQLYASYKVGPEFRVTKGGCRKTRNGRNGMERNGTEAEVII